MNKLSESLKKPALSQRLNRYIDLNTDYGQTPEKAFFQNPAESLLPFVSSVNIPCCVHDGDPKETLEAIHIAKSFNCAVGAHIGYPDPKNLGYEFMDIDDDDLKAWILLQLGAFNALCKAKKIELEHVRPHGALYGKMVDDAHTAQVVAEAIYQFDPWTVLSGPAGSALEQAASETGLRVAGEVYLGKRYSNEGKLVRPRFNDNLPLPAILDQAKQLITDSSITSIDGKVVPMKFMTLHISPRLEGGITVAEKMNSILGQPAPLSVVAAGASGWV